MLTAQRVHDRLVAEAAAEGRTLAQPIRATREAMAADPATAPFVADLPARLDRAIRRDRVARLIHGRPPKTLSGRNGRNPLNAAGQEGRKDDL